ncbi:MAG: ABC transporter permease [Bacteroidota bacterium]
MFHTHLLILLRKITRNRQFFFLNIAGLAIGIMASIMILEYVSHEWSYDGFHTKSDRIYRVINERFQQGKMIQKGMITYPSVSPAMKRDYPEVILNTRMMPIGRSPIKIEDKVFIEDDAYAADENFLQIFDYPLLAGDRNTCLSEVNCMVVSREVAHRFFGDNFGSYESLIGRIVLADEDLTPFTITGVLEDIPENSHLSVNLLISYETLIQYFSDAFNESWTMSEIYHYVLLSEEADPDLLQQKFDDFSQRYFEGDRVSGSEEKFSLQPLLEAHLYSDLEYEIGNTNNGQVVNALFFVAILILAIAWINYINLTTGKAIERAKEVGIRKVLGATRKEMIRQFLFESIILNLFAVLIAVILLGIVHPYFNQYMGTTLSLSLLFGSGYKAFFMGGILIIVLVAGSFLSGLYPAFILSAYKPSSVLKGNFTNSLEGRSLRRGLVVFQFASSIILIAATITVYSQLTFMAEKDLGFSLGETLIIEGPEMTHWDSTYIQRADLFKNALRGNPDILGVSTSRNIPGDNLGRLFNLQGPNTLADQNLTTRHLSVDYEFITTYGIEVLEGRNFTELDHNPDFSLLKNVMINEKVMELLEFSSPAEAVGQTVRFWRKEWTIIGVVENFHQASPRYPIEPIVLIPSYSTNGYFSATLASGSLQKVLPEVSTTFDEFFPGNAFTYYMLDEHYNTQFQEEKTFSQFFAFFSGLAIFISCLGLLGLSSYHALRKTKEIGIRKVFGATVNHLIFWLSREFMFLIGIAILAAVPLLIIFSKQWLAQYAYRIPLGAEIVLFPLLIALTIAILTISLQTWKAANADPIQSLKHE